MHIHREVTIKHCVCVSFHRVDAACAVPTIQWCIMQSALPTAHGNVL